MSARGSCLPTNDVGDNPRCQVEIVAKQETAKWGQWRGRTCAAVGCGSPAKCKGLCTKHYQRYRKHGALDVDKRRNREPIKWLLNHKEHNDPDCLYWPFRLDKDGYGSITLSGKNRRAHRAMCRLAHGKPTYALLHAAHTCGNKKCVNPSHLRWATPLENSQDKYAHGTILLGEMVPVSVLTEKQARSAINRLASGETCVSIAKDYGVSAGAILKIKHGKSWAWLNGL